MSLLSGIATRASTAVSRFISFLENGPGYELTEVTWDLDDKQNLCVSLVTLPEEDYEKQWEMYTASEGSDRGTFKLKGGKRKVIGRVERYTSQQALEMELFNMVRPYRMERAAQGKSEGDGGAEVNAEIKKVAASIWSELVASESNTG